MVLENFKKIFLRFVIVIYILIHYFFCYNIYNYFFILNFSEVVLWVVLYFIFTDPKYFIYFYAF